MDKESFVETLRVKYAEEIREAYLECQHNGKVDHTAFGPKLLTIMKQAKAEGLPETDFIDLMKSAVPENLQSPLKKGEAA